MTEMLDDEKNRVFIFEQTKSLADWASISRAFLGSVNIVTQGSDRLVTLTPVLESDRKDVLTVVNPVDAKIRMEATDTLEVVVYDHRLESDRKWDYFIDTADNGMKVQQISGEIMQPTMLKHGHTLRRAFDKTSTEWHFWFQFDWTSKVALTTLGDGTYAAGGITFTVKGNESFFKRELSLWLQIKTATSKKIQAHVQGLGTVNVDGNLLQVPPVKVKHSANTSIIRVSGNQTCNPNYDCWDDYMGDKDWPTNHNKQYYKSYKDWATNKIRDTSLRERKDNVSLDSGCNVIYLENSLPLKE